MAQHKTNDELNEFELQFIDCYFNCNFNGRLAYKMLKPNTTDGSADVLVSRMLSKVKIKNEIEKRQELIRQKQTIKVEDNIQLLNSLIYELKSEAPTTYDANGKVVDKRDNRSILTAVDMLNKLAGLYTPKRLDITTNGETITPTILVNIVPPKE